ncbi:MAG: type I-E CRISPR-associated protein Cse1/CasA [Dehalococcoidia bacterium]
MAFSFNLIDEPWLPCVLADGSQTELGLRDALARATEIVEIVGDTPPITAALHRLLLAMLHRCFGPENAAAWQVLWQRGAFEMAAIDRYLDEWRPRFDLFDEARPFYQTAAVDVGGAGSVAKLLFQADNNPTLFDHAHVADPPALSPARAARLVLLVQGFDTGGLKAGTGSERYAKAGPLIQCAVMMVRDVNLFQTLMLNLIRYSPENGWPWDFDPAKDRPAWERSGTTQPDDRYPDGYLDLLTWQNRRVRLIPEAAADRETVIRRAVVMKGYQFPDAFNRRGHETMVAFRKSTAANAPDPYPPVGFREERALWRDSLALLHVDAGEGERPRMLEWLGQLVHDEVLDPAVRLRLDFVGLAADRAKLLFWRHDRLTVPAAYLEESKDDQPLLDALKPAIELAERAGRLLRSGLAEVWVDGVPLRAKNKDVWAPSPMRVLAEEMLGANGAAGELVEHLAPERGYWWRLEEAFRELLLALPDDVVTDTYGDRRAGATALPRWTADVGDAAQRAFDEAVAGLDVSATGMRAVAKADREMRRLLRGMTAVFRAAEPAVIRGGATA